MRSLSLSFVLAGALSLVACAAPSADSTTTTQNETDAVLTPGTYRLASAVDAWTIKQLVLKTDGDYVVEMYPGRAFPIDDTQTTTGKYSVASDTLTIRFQKGNVFEKWSVEPQGEKLHFTDLVERDSEFDMERVSDDTSDPAPEPLKGTDPGMPSSVSGGVSMRCHSGAGDIFANLSLASSGAGRMKLSSTESLQLTSTESVTLKKNDNGEDDTDWLSVTGNGNATDGKRYIFQIPRSFLRNGRTEDISMFVGSQDEDDAQEDAWGMSCSVQ